MALLQKLSDARGVSTVYHRIAKADADFTDKEVTLVVYSYVAESLRSSEKREAEDKAVYEQLTEELNNLIQDPTEENEARRIELSEQLNNLNPVNEITERHVGEATYTMPVEDNFTLPDAYAWLKVNIFTDAKDVL